MCGTISASYPSYEALVVATHLGNSLWDEPPGWVNGRPPEQITGDEGVTSDQFTFQQGIISIGTHLGPECRGLANRYYG